jgi:hypothetical protein
MKSQKSDLHEEALRGLAIFKRAVKKAIAENKKLERKQRPKPAS